MVTIYEQRGIEKGIEKGIGRGKRASVLLALNTRFGAVPQDVQQRIEKIDSPGRLDAILLQALDQGTKSLDDLQL